MADEKSSHITILSFIVFLGVGLCIIGDQYKQNECLITQTSNHINLAWLMVSLGVCIVITSLLGILNILDFPDHFVKKVILSLMVLPVLGIFIIPTIMIIMIMKVPICAFEPNVFIILYITIASVFNLFTIMAVIILIHIIIEYISFDEQ